LLRLCRLFHSSADVNEVVGDDAEADPAIHPDGSLVPETAESVSPFDEADAPLAPGTPLLAATEPALFLLAFAFKAFGGAIGNTRRRSSARFTPLERLDADPELLSIVRSWHDTLGNAKVLSMLREYNATGKVTP
jgi:hypothetical protein